MNVIVVVVKLEGGSDEDVELLKHQKVEDDVLADIGEKETEEVETTDNENGEIMSIFVILRKFLVNILFRKKCQFVQERRRRKRCNCTRLKLSSSEM